VQRIVDIEGLGHPRHQSGVSDCRTGTWPLEARIRRVSMGRNRTLSTTLPIFFIVLLLVGSYLATPSPSDSSTSALAARLDSAVAQLAAAYHSLESAGTRTNATTTGTFWENYTVGGGTPSNLSAIYCDQYYPGYYCFPQAAAPSVLPLPNGKVGYAYESFTNSTTNTCPLALNNTTEVRVEFSISADGGRTFGSPLDVGNTTCPYFQALEPSFTVGASGTIYGAFVESNATPSSLNCRPGCSSFWGQGLFYAPRVSDALGFVSSTNLGSSFRSALTISQAGSANIADPSIASYGDTVYVTYMDLNNTTSAAVLGGSTANPISAELVYSSDAGATWHGPYTLPGFNATEYYNAMNPQVTVGPTGTVYVAYSSDRHCIAYCTYTSQEYGDDIYLATSTTNGTTWTSHLVAKDTANAEQLDQTPDGVSFSNGAASGPFLFEEGPAITLAVAPSTGTVYVAWTGAINESAHYYCGPPLYAFSYGCIYASYAQTVLMVATSTNGGSTWTNTSVGPYEDYYQQGAPNGEFLPGLGVAPSGTLYLTYANYNGTLLANGCYQEGSYGDIGFQGQWVTSSPDGTNWTSPELVAWNYNGQGGWWATGWTSSVAFNVTTGSPLIGYTLTGPTTNLPVGPDGLYTWPGFVQLAMPYSGPTTTLTLSSNGLPGGTAWKAWVMGLLFNTTASNLTITNAPLDRALWVKSGLPVTYVGYGAAYLANLSLPVDNYGYSFEGGQKFVNLTGPGTFDFNFSLYYFLNLTLQPGSLTKIGLDFSIFDPSYNYAQGVFYQNGAFGGGCPLPWLVPAGWQLHLTGFRGVGVLPSHELYYDDQGAGAIGFFNGTGPGSYTGAGPNITITMNGPINETGWVGSYGVYNITVGAPTLPVGSSVHFDWAGAPYSFLSPGPTTVRNVSTGIYPITNIWAGASRTGYEYFGESDNGNPVVVPNNPVINLSFAYVDVAAPTVAVSFVANGTTPGTPWQLQFNGTPYASSTPWINVTTRPGTFAISGFPLVAANGSEAYVPVGLSPTLNITSGGTYTINFTRAFAVTVAPSQGGTVSPSGSTFWVPPGTAQSFTATPRTGYSFGGWNGKGAGSYTGDDLTANITAYGPIVETPIFYPLPANHYSLTFQEGTLPRGTPWSVFVDGTGYSTTSSVLTIPDLYGCSDGAIGTYTIEVPYVYVNGTTPERFAPGTYPSTLCGGSPPLDPGFLAQFLVNVQNTTGGSATATPTTTLVPVSGAFWVPGGETVVLQATPDTGYAFTGWAGSGTGSYTGPGATTDLPVTASVTEIAEFETATAGSTLLYTVDFHSASAPPTGISWSVVVGSTSYVSSTQNLWVTGVSAGHYTVSVPVTQSPDGQTEWTPTAPPSTLTVTSNETVPLSFQTLYWISVRVIGSGSATPSSEWAIAGAGVAISATSDGGDVFAGWSGTGNGSYTGSSPDGTVTAHGPIQEIATFAPPGPLAGSTGSNAWSSPAAIAGLAIAGLIVGGIVGGLLARRRRSVPVETPPSGETAHPTEDAGEVDP
jgi:hypothetical protein